MTRASISLYIYIYSHTYVYYVYIYIYTHIYIYDNHIISYDILWTYEERSKNHRPDADPSVGGPSAA